MGDLIRACDWAATPIGAMAQWSPTLRTMVPFMLANRFPMLLWWGPHYVSLYNDAYRPILGVKHPAALGQPVSLVWSEIWHILKPLIDTPFQGGPATWNDDIELEINRYGFTEETHFIVAYSAVPDAAAPGGIGGVLATVNETTEKVIAERRIVILRDLSTGAADATTAEDACVLAAETLDRHAKDLPFALIYLLDDDGTQARLCACAGAAPGDAISPPLVALTPGAGSTAGWPLADATGLRVVDDLTARFAAVPPGPWADPPDTAVVLPIASAGARRTMGYLVVGVSARLKLDAAYRDFLALLKTQIATAIGNARARDEERRRAEALAEIDRAKTAFFSNVSHEFRTPLTLMLGPLEEAKAQLARSGASLASSPLPEVDLAHRNALRLLKLVNTLLDFSRIEAGRVQATYEPTDLATATADLASVFRAAIETAGLTLIVDCPPLEAPVYVDRDMWEKIVLNLLSNAFKFTFDGEIEVRLRAVDGHAVLSVRDTGAGIPAEELPRLFERFHRVAGTHGRTHEGSGIGLALVQELATQHGGSVAVQSVPGRGSLFSVAIPLGRAHLAEARIAPARPQAPSVQGAAPFVAEALRWLPGAAEAEAVVRDIDIPASAGKHPVPRSRILLADDNADMRDYVRRLLAARHEVEAVADGQAALDAIARNKPDLVLSDVMMPRLDGLQLLARLRADPETSTLPVILVSARAGEESRVEGMQSGADDYLIKPFSARELLARVEAHVKMSIYRREATATLRESEERFRNMADNIAQLAWTADRLGEATWYNKRWLDYTGVSLENRQGWDWRQLNHPDHVERVVAGVMRARDSGEPWEDTFPLRGRDGTYRWFLSRAVPIRDGAGRIVRWFGTNTDITELRQAQDVQRMLTGELSHRVKNMLATVQAIAVQTLRHNSNPVEFVGNFGGRIQSMARVHALLSSSNWQAADLRDVIRDQLLLGPTDETRVTAWGPSVALPPQIATQVAMILHELGTNSLKYGALSKADGVVSIGWSVEGNAVRLHWSERGGPPAQAPVKRGFGAALIEQSAKSAGGSAHMSMEADGVRWQIALPLPRHRTATMTSPPADVAEAALAREAAGRIDIDTPLAGHCFLVVEDEPLVALDVVASLEQAGADIAGSVGSAAEALALIGSKRLDAALLDANLAGRPVDDIAAALTRRNVPFAFVTGYGRESLPQAFADAPVLSKPFSQQQLLDAATALVRRADNVRRLRES